MSTFAIITAAEDLQVNTSLLLPLLPLHLSVLQKQFLHCWNSARMCRSSFWWSSKTQNSWPTFYHCAFPNIVKKSDWYQTEFSVEFRGACYIVYPVYTLNPNTFTICSSVERQRLLRCHSRRGVGSVLMVIWASLHNQLKETGNQAVGTDSGYDRNRCKNEVRNRTGGVPCRRSLIWSDPIDYSTRRISFVFK